MFSAGAYVSTILVQQFGVNYWVSFLAGAFSAVILGAFIGVPSLRLRGTYFSIITIAFAQVVYIVERNWFSVTGGTDGLLEIPNITLFGIDFLNKMNYAYLFIAMTVITFLMVRALVQSRVGRAFIAIRDGADLALTTGINTTMYKIISFLTGSFIAGYAGALYAPLMRFIDPEDFTLGVMLNVLSALVIGGARTFWGPIIGAIFIIALPEVLIPLRAYLFLIQGILMVLIIIYFPGGIMGGVYKLTGWWKRRRSAGGANR
jgi:branched-chain amino acid transport system permease protein